MGTEDVQATEEDGKFEGQMRAGFFVVQRQFIFCIYCSDIWILKTCYL